MDPIPRQNIPLLLMMAVLAAMFFFSFGTNDVRTWLIWMDNLNEHGIIEGYRLNNHDYPPFMSMLVFAFTSIAGTLGLPTLIGFKFLLLVFLGIATTMLYHGLKKDILPTFLFYLFLLISALCLGYIDICVAPFLLLFCYFIYHKKTAWAVFSFTLACLLKFSPLIIAPFIFIYLLHVTQFNSKAFFKAAVLPAALLLIPLFLFFGALPLKAFTVGATHTYLSANALNFNWIVTRIIQIFLEGNTFFEAWQNSTRFIDTPPPWAIALAKTLFVGFYSGSLFVFFRSEKTLESLLLFCILGHMAYFMFNTGVHENHLFVACLLAMALTCLNREHQMLAFSLCFISALNMIAFYGINGESLQIWPDWYTKECLARADTFCTPPIDYRLLLALCNTIYFLQLWIHIVFKNIDSQKGDSHV